MKTFWIIHSPEEDTKQVLQRILSLFQHYFYVQEASVHKQYTEWKLRKDICSLPDDEEKRAIYLNFRPKTLFPMPARQYVEELQNALGCSASTCILATWYMSRILERNAWMRITRFNLHLVFAGCLLLAFKVWEEDSITNKVFARAAGIGVKTHTLHRTRHSVSIGAIQASADNPARLHSTLCHCIWRFRTKSRSIRSRLR